MLRRPPTSPLFPYTTLFRSQILMNDKPPAPLPFEQKGKGIFGDLLPRLHTVAVVLPAVLPDQFADLPFHPLAGFQQAGKLGEPRVQPVKEWMPFPMKGGSRQSASQTVKEGQKAGRLADLIPVPVAHRKPVDHRRDQPPAAVRVNRR